MLNRVWEHGLLYLCLVGQISLLWVGQDILNTTCISLTWPKKNVVKNTSCIKRQRIKQKPLIIMYFRNIDRRFVPHKWWWACHYPGKKTNLTERDWSKRTRHYQARNKSDTILSFCSSFINIKWPLRTERPVFSAITERRQMGNLYHIQLVQPPIPYTTTERRLSLYGPIVGVDKGALLDLVVDEPQRQKVWLLQPNFSFLNNWNQKAR